MNNPLTAIDDKLKAIAADIEQKALIAALREVAAIHLSRLVTLDTDRAAAYQSALTLIDK